MPNCVAHGDSTHQIKDQGRQQTRKTMGPGPIRVSWPYWAHSGLLVGAGAPVARQHDSGRDGYAAYPWRQRAGRGGRWWAGAGQRWGLELVG